MMKLFSIYFYYPPNMFILYTPQPSSPLCLLSPHFTSLTLNADAISTSVTWSSSTITPPKSTSTSQPNYSSLWTLARSPPSFSKSGNVRQQQQQQIDSMGIFTLWDCNRYLSTLTYQIHNHLHLCFKSMEIPNPKPNFHFHPSPPFPQQKQKPLRLQPLLTDSQRILRFA